MRWRFLLSALAFCWVLGGLAVAASANTTGTYTVPFTSSYTNFNEQNASPYPCGSGGFGAPTFGNAYSGATTDYTTSPLSAWFSIPSGATLVGGTIRGSAEVAGPGTGTFTLAFEGGPIPPVPSSSDSCTISVASGPSTAAVDFASGWTSTSFSADGYRLAYDMLHYPSNSTGQEYVLGEPGWSVGPSTPQTYIQLTSALSLMAQYAFTPTGIAIGQVQSGNGTQVTVSWGANGNASGTEYVLQRETIGPAGVTQGWTTIYQGTATSFSTTDQGCGNGYAYRVAAAGPDAQTPWDTTGEWDEFPCSVSLGTASTTSVPISWPAVTASTDYVVVWCVSGSCAQTQDNVGAGVTSATLTGLTPNTEYTVWVCSGTNMWGCPVASTWTQAAVPNGLSAVDDGTPPQGLVSWGADGNPSGTTYAVSIQTLAPDGQWAAAPTTPCVTTATSCQTSGLTWDSVYAFYVRAENGAGQWTSWAGPEWFAVAPHPSVSAASSSGLDVSWPSLGNGADYEVYWNAVGQPCCSNSGALGTGTTAYSITGLTPATGYSVSVMAWIPESGGGWCGGGSCWWGNAASTAYTAPAEPSGAALGGITQTALSVTWGANGNPSGTQYSVSLYQCADLSSAVANTSTTAFSAHFMGLPEGTCYQGAVAALNGAGQSSAIDWTGQAPTVPATPALSGSGGGLGWSSTAGRGYVTLSWPAVTGATGYTVWVYDGTTYEPFPVGSATSWDSREALIYPPDASLYPNVSEASKAPPVFSHSAGGLDLRDLPHDLYCTTGSFYCGGGGGSPQNYWLAVSAYNASGDSAMGGNPCAFNCYMPTLPLQTDPNAPVVTDWQVNNGGAYTYAGSVPYTLDASESPSGIAAYALSNDGSTWTTYAVSGCTVGQAAACQGSLSASGTWDLSPGPGSKTVYARLESAAGVWSAPVATTVYVNVDQTTPTVDVALDGGAARTSSTLVTVAVDISDPAAAAAGATWTVRYSTDGGTTWSAWQSEGTATRWSTPWTIPGGASGERTVLVQVENSDHNLGQGAATIDYAAPDTGGGAGLPVAGGSTACQWPVAGTDVPATCTTTSQVTVPLSPPSGAVQMRISLDDATWGPWQATATRIAVDIGSAPGAKTVWVQYQDGAGTVTAESPVFYVYDPGVPRLSATWAGNASATDSSGGATLLLQATDDVQAGLTLTVTENGATLYQGAYTDSLPLTLTGTGYQMVQVTVTDIAGSQTSTELGIYVE